MNPMDLASVTRALAALAAFLKEVAPRSLLTTMMLVAAYAGSQIVAEGGNIYAGLRRAFVLSDETKAVEARDRSNAHVQAELFIIQRSNAQIERQLTNTLLAIPTASRARVAIFHNGIYTLSGVGLLRFDITHGVARPGRAVGEFVANLPLSQLSEYLDGLLARQCVHLRTDDLTNEAAVARMTKLNIGDFLVCPVINPNNEVLGALFVSWDRSDAAPKDLAPATAVLRHSAVLIGISLDLRPGLSARR